VTLFVALGAGVYSPVIVVLLVRPGALSEAQYGTVAAIAGLVGVAGSLAAGLLVDRWGPVACGVVGTALQAAAMAALALSSAFVVVLFTMSMFMLCTQVASVGRGTLVATVASEGERSQARGYTYAMANLGLALGSGLGALLASFDTVAALQCAVFADALFLAIAGVLLWSFVIGTGTFAAPSNSAARNPLLTRLNIIRPATLGIAISSILLGVQSAIVTVALPVWAVIDRGVSAGWIGVWATIGTLTAVVCHVQVAGWTSTPRRAGQAQMAGFCVLTVSLTIIVLAQEWRGSALVVALSVVAVCLGLANSAFAASVWSVSYATATDQTVGLHQGLFNTALGLSGALSAPLLIACVRHGAAGWCALWLVFLVGTVGFVIGVRETRERRLNGGNGA
jgi:predicted MFS family arabinose efflux permease